MPTHDTHPPPAAAVYPVRWMIRSDLPAVLRIEAASFERPWTGDDFLRCLCARNCIGYVGEVDGWVAGYLVYELALNTLQILNLAVAPEYRGRGVGSWLVRRLVRHLHTHRRARVLALVRETDLAAQLWFRGRGFTAAEVVRGHFPDTGEAAYAMEVRA